MTDNPLSHREQQRYARQLQLPEVGERGQHRIKKARVLVVGAGGLGCPLGLYLAAAGVGHLTLVDGDRVELSNLQRQIAFTEDDLGAFKAEAAARRLAAANGDIRVLPVREFLTLENAEALIREADMVVDCSDNFATRYLVNDFCLHLQKPWLFAAVNRFQGSLCLFTGEGACFRCLYPEQPMADNCNAAGVMGAVPGIMGVLQASEVINYLLGLSAASTSDRLVLYDALGAGLRSIALEPDSACLCSRGQIDPYKLNNNNEIDDKYDSKDEVSLSWEEWFDLATRSKTQLVDIRSPAERQAGHAGGVHIPAQQVDGDLFVRDPDTTVGLYCQAGRRSSALARRLRARGFHNAYSLAGGIAAWLRAERWRR